MTSRHSIIYLLLFFVLQMGLSCSINKPVVKPLNSVFATVPEDHRDRLWDRMRELEKYRKEHDWGRYFELLEKQFAINGEYLPKTKEEYIERQKEIYKDDDFYEFIPQSARNAEYGYWWIDGCVGYGTKVIKYYKALLFAKLEDGEWFFSNCFAPYYSSDDTLLPCKEE